MVSRLHNFDGSMTDPTSQVIYAEYAMGCGKRLSRSSRAPSR